MPWRKRQRAEQILDDIDPARHQWRYQPAIRAGIPPQSGSRCFYGALQYDCRAVVQGMSQRNRRFNPMEAIAVQRQTQEETRRSGKRMDRRTDVMPEARQRQLSGACSPADGRRCFDHEHRFAGPRQRDGRRQAVRSRADDDGVMPSCRPHHFGALNNRRNHRTGAASWCRMVRICALYQIFPTRDHCTLVSRS